MLLMNERVYKFLCADVFILFGHIPSGIAGSCGNSMFNTFRDCQTVLQSTCTTLHSHQQCMRALNSLHPYYTLQSAREISTPAPSSHLVQPKWGKKPEKHSWRSQSLGTGSPKDWDLIIRLWLYYLTITILKALPLPFWRPTYHSSFHPEHHTNFSTKKITWQTKRQKHSLKRLNKNQNQSNI